MEPAGRSMEPARRMHGMRYPRLLARFPRPPQRRRVFRLRGRLLMDATYQDRLSLNQKAEIEQAAIDYRAWLPPMMSNIDADYVRDVRRHRLLSALDLSLIHISEPTRRTP